MPVANYSTGARCKVRFIYKSTFRHIRGDIKHVKIGRFYQHYCVKTKKHSRSIMVLGVFELARGRRGRIYKSQGLL